jgi:hypothetical protein
MLLGDFLFVCWRKIDIGTSHQSIHFCCHAVSFILVDLLGLKDPVLAPNNVTRNVLRCDANLVGAVGAACVVSSAYQRCQLTRAACGGGGGGGGVGDGHNLALTATRLHALWTT